MEPTLLQIIVLAIVQGIAEFLPISSSGHLVIFAALMGVDAERFDLVELNIVLHSGTLGAILLYYRKPLLRLVAEDRRVLLLLVVATLPAVVVALLLKGTGADHLLSSPLVAGICLLATGGILLASKWIPQRELHYREMSWFKALLVGVAQSIAILPGISRSGSTICTGLGLGLSRDQAATFSFLMAVPAIAGACVLEGAKLLKDPSTTTSAPMLLLGAAISFAVGYASLAFLIRIVKYDLLHWFAAWCFLAGIGVIVWQVMN